MSLFKQSSPEIDQIKYTATVSGAAYAVFAYAFFWIVFTVWTGINHRSAVLFTVNSMIIAIEALGVYLIVRHAKKAQIKKIQYKQLYLNAAILISALHWGGLTTYIINFSDINSGQELAVWLVVAGFCSIGSMLFCMVKPVSYIYTLFVGLPHVFTECFQHDGYSGFMFFLIIALLAFSVKANKIIQQSYQSLIQSLSEANMHADLMEKVSMYDYQTGVYTNFHFIKEYELIWKRSAISGSPLGLISIEVDQFRDFKYVHGNHISSQCMKAIADILKDIVTPSDAVGLYDGNTFMIVMPDIKEEKTIEFANEVLAKVKNIALRNNERNVPIELTCSIGLVCANNIEALDPEALIDLSLRALRDAQQKGLSQYHLSSEY